MTSALTTFEVKAGVAVNPDTKKKKLRLRHFADEHTRFHKRRSGFADHRCGKWWQNFAYKPPGPNYSSIAMTEIEKFVEITSKCDAKEVLNKRVKLGQTAMYVITYLG